MAVFLDVGVTVAFVGGLLAAFSQSVLFAGVISLRRLRACVL